MLHLNSSTVYFWYNGAADMRKSFDALCGLVNQHCQTNVLQGGVFICVNKKRNQIKLLTWEGDGLAIYYKRLEKGVYEFPPYLPIAAVLPLMPFNCNWFYRVLYLNLFAKRNGSYYPNK